MRKTLWGVLGLALAGCGGGRGGEDAAPAETAAWVGRENMVIAESRELQVGPAISGTLEAERQATVRAELGATVMAIAAEEGQPVARGAVLARLDDSAIRDARESSRLAVRSAEVNLALATRELERATALVAAGAVAERDVETARLALSAAEAQLAQAKSQLASAEKQLDKTVIRAPISGLVSERPVHLGDVVQSGAVLFTLVDPGSLKFEATVPVEALAELKVGAPVSFTVAGLQQAEVIGGRVTRINPAADPATRQVRLTVAVPNASGRLIAGLFAEGRVALSTRTGVVVPSGAVDRRGIRPYVVRLQQGRVERADVELGLIDAAREQMEIVSGVRSGDTLLLGGARGLTPGTPVRIGSPAELTGGQAATVPGRE